MGFGSESKKVVMLFYDYESKKNGHFNNDLSLSDMHMMPTLLGHVSHTLFFFVCVSIIRNKNLNFDTCPTIILQFV